MPTQCGYIALIGRPNVGKSTLLNQLIGQKLSATAAKPQTTRHRIIGIRSEADSQMIFIDTPGLHTHAQGQRALNRVLNRTAWSGLADADCILWLIEAKGLQAEDQKICQGLASVTVPLIIVINKIDRLTEKAKLLPLLQTINDLHIAHAVVPIAARTGENLENLLRTIRTVLPEREFIYASEQITDRSERFFAAELVREQLIRLLDKELPYVTTVEVESFIEHPDHYQIDVVIWVEKESQKAIIIGKQGQKLKQIGTRARQAMQKMFATRVHLQTWVKVKQGWADDERSLRSLGYDET